MILIGLTGPIGHGKTTFASAIEKLVRKVRHFESSLIIAEVADAMHKELKEPIDPYDLDALNQWLKSLPEILTKVTHTYCAFEQIKLEDKEIQQHPIEYQKLIMHVENLRRNFTLAHQKITDENKETYRPFLQWLGGYLVQKVDKGIWYNEIVRRVQLAQNEGVELCVVGGLRFPNDATILREAGGIIIKVYRPGHLQNDMLDPTERERENINVDTTIASEGAIEAVEKTAKLVLDDIQAGNLQHTYQTGH